MSSAIVIVSGGIDSVTLAYDVKQRGSDLTLLSFDYGQKHRKEIHFARLAAHKLESKHILLKFPDLSIYLSGSSLTDDRIEVPEGHYAEPSMKATVVPNRNAIMLSIAAAIASSNGIGSISAAFHAGDHFIYPDCRPTFVESFQAMLGTSLEGFLTPIVDVPYIRLSKSEIVARGAAIGVPFKDTWSCYNGRTLHCGLCGTCYERKEAFSLAGIEDPTEYEGG